MTSRWAPRMRVTWKRVMFAWRWPYSQSKRPLPVTLHVYGPSTAFVWGAIEKTGLPMLNHSVAGCVTTAESLYQKLIHNSRSWGVGVVLMVWKLTLMAA